MAKPPAKKGSGPSGHKRFGSSNSKQWLTCAGSIALIESLPPEERKRTDTIYSRRGTAAHAVGEMCLVSYRNNPKHATQPEDYLGQVVEGVVIDEEIVEGVEVYVKWGRERIDAADYVEIERSGSLYNYITSVQGESGKFLSLNGHEYGGTGDFVSAQVMGRLDIGDYKNGRSYVCHVGVSQLRIYALDALVELGPEFDFDEIALTIIQPNAPGEPVRTWVTSPEEMFEWAETVLLPGAEKCVEAIQALASGMNRHEFAAKYLVADLQGHCHFCPAKSRCAAACDSVSEVALLEFVEVMDCGANELDLILPDPALITEEQETLLLQHADGIIEFIKAVQARAHARAERGERVEGQKLVAKGGARRKYCSEDEHIKRSCKSLGLSPQDYMEAPGLKSPAQLEKAFKKRGVSPERVKEFMAQHVIKPDSGTLLVSLDDPRAELRPAIESEFADLFDTPDDILDL
jgi:hypothetical protein